MLSTVTTQPQGKDFEDEETLEQFVIQVPAVSVDVLGRDVKEIFASKPEAEGVVVLNGDEPLGIIMRTTFFQKLGSLYGNSLFMERPIKILVDTSVLTVNMEDRIASIGVDAMNRPQSKLYDYVIVLKNKKFAGVISIRLFLIGLSKRNEAQISVLKSQQQLLLDAHKQEVDLRNSLISKSHTVKNLLDHAGQGFLLFGSDLMIKEEFSVECTKIFKENIGGENYIGLITQYFGEDKAPVFSAALTGYFANSSPVTDNVYLMLLPAEGVIAGKNIHFEYKRVENSGAKSVMVILNDVSEHKAMEKAMADEQNTQRLIIKALTYQEQIRQMIDEFKELFEKGYRGFFEGQNNIAVSLDELFRAVHTFKGDFAQYGFVNSAEQLHIFEDKLQFMVKHVDTVELRDIDRLICGLDAGEILAKDLHTIASVLGDGFFGKNEMLSIPKERLETLERVIENGPASLKKNEISELINGLKKKNLKIFLKQYEDYLQYLSQRLLKNMPAYFVEGDDIYIDQNEYNDILKSLVHVHRNIMDHGLEADEERLACGKPEQGVILCQIQRAGNDKFSISISDDGRGISTEKLRLKAEKSGLYTPEQLAQMPEQEIIKLIFLDHFSTKENADTLSGRGMGMAAVKCACEKLGGQIEVNSKNGSGTTFVITLPYKQ